MFSRETVYLNALGGRGEGWQRRQVRHLVSGPEGPPSILLRLFLAGSRSFFLSSSLALRRPRAPPPHFWPRARATRRLVALSLSLSLSLALSFSLSLSLSLSFSLSFSLSLTLSLSLSLARSLSLPLSLSLSIYLSLSFCLPPATPPPPLLVGEHKLFFTVTTGRPTSDRHV